MPRQIAPLQHSVAPPAGRPLLGEHPAVLEALSIAERIAETPATVLITGESGTGKSLLARRLHESSGRRGRFVEVACGSLSDSLLESELFGHVAGRLHGSRLRPGGTVSAGRRGNDLPRRDRHRLPRDAGEAAAGAAGTAVRAGRRRPHAHGRRAGDPRDPRGPRKARRGGEVSGRPLLADQRRRHRDAVAAEPGERCSTAGRPFSADGSLPDGAAGGGLHQRRRRGPARPPVAGQRPRTAARGRAAACFSVAARWWTSAICPFRSRPRRASAAASRRHRPPRSRPRWPSPNGS